MSERKNRLFFFIPLLFFNFLAAPPSLLLFRPVFSLFSEGEITLLLLLGTKHKQTMMPLSLSLLLFLLRQKTEPFCHLPFLYPCKHQGKIAKGALFGNGTSEHFQTFVLPFSKKNFQGFGPPKKETQIRFLFFSFFASASCPKVGPFPFPDQEGNGVKTVSE